MFLGRAGETDVMNEGKNTGTAAIYLSNIYVPRESRRNSREERRSSSYLSITVPWGKAEGTAARN